MAIIYHMVENIKAASPTVVALLIFLWLSPTDTQEECGRPSVSPKMGKTKSIGSMEATPHSWPWQAIVQLTGQQACAAILIDDTHLVTSALCFRRSSNQADFKVVLGLHDRLAHGLSSISVDVDRIIVHECFNSPKKHSNDIAIIKLRSPVDFTSTSSIHPICLPEVDVPISEQCIVTGWGDRQGQGYNRYLRQASVRIVSSIICNNSQHYNGRIDGTMLCAGGIGRHSCQGDTGGPLVCQRSDGTWELQGSVSWGEECGRTNRPVIYSRVYALKGWIEQHMNEQSPL